MMYRYALYALAALTLIMSLVSFTVMGLDKHRARKNARRVPERSLFTLALLFGAVGGSAGMYLFRHKTRHWYFALFFPLLALAQLALLGYLGYMAFLYK